MMLYKDYSAIAMDNLEYVCYMTDVETYDILYINKKAQALLGIKDEKDYLGKKCYNVLCGLDKPCPSCNNDRLELGKPIIREQSRALVLNGYRFIDKLMILDGRKVRIETGMDMSEQVNQLNELRSKLTKEETLVRCVQTLALNNNVEKAADSLLEIVVDYYQAERAYIFELDYEKNLMSNTYEYCVDGAQSQKEHCSLVPITWISRWFDNFDKYGEMTIFSVEDEIDKETEEYKALSSLQIKSLLAAPLIDAGSIIGFIGVDNPAYNQNDTRLLSSVALFVVNDLGQRKLQDILSELSYVDTLTGVGNRNKYMYTIKSFEKKPPKQLGIIYADINGLKPANDIYGHEYGDKLIVKTAKLLKEYFKNQVYRVGGDEYVVLCIDMDKNVFDDLLTSFRERIECDSDYSVSIGSVWKKGKIDIAKEISSSDELMYEEKQSYYKSSLASGRNYRSLMVRELVQEIEAGAFEIFLQPKVMLSTKQIISAEALVRKRTSDGNYISPDKFIPIYESEKTVKHLDLHVVELVCIMLKDWIANDYPLKISVNLSRVSLLENTIVTEIIDICKKYDIPPKWLDFEIAENGGKIDYSILRKRLESISEAGFSVSLDDFGSEYSNLLMLTTMEFSQIKIDKSLINQLGTGNKNMAIVEHAIKLCQDSTNTQTLAEGIETDSQCELLEKFNCDYGQGYLFAKPMPVSEFLQVYLKQLNEIAQD